MKENVLLTLSQDFASDIISLANELRRISNLWPNQKKWNQYQRNIAEANYPQSRAHMVLKFEIALKEANETENWLDLIYKSNMLYDEKYKLLKAKIVNIKILLIKSINTLKASIK